MASQIARYSLLKRSYEDQTPLGGEAEQAGSRGQAAHANKLGRVTSLRPIIRSTQ